MWSNQTSKKVDSGGRLRSRDLEHDDAAAGPHHPGHLRQATARGRRSCGRRTRRWRRRTRRLRYGSASALAGLEPHDRATRARGRLGARQLEHPLGEVDRPRPRRPAPRAPPARTPDRPCRWRRQARARPATAPRGRPRADATGGGGPRSSRCSSGRTDRLSGRTSPGPGVPRASRVARRRRTVLAHGPRWRCYCSSTGS